MTATKLTRERKREYVLDGAGRIELASAWRSAATLTAEDGRVWEIARRGLRQKVEITDSAGGEPATFEKAGMLKQGGTLTVGGVVYELRKSATFSERYALARNGDELATMEAGGWSVKKPVKVETHGEVDDLVLLAATWLVKEYAGDSSTAAVAAAT